jgi:hypothetical protein
MKADWKRTGSGLEADWKWTGSRQKDLYQLTLAAAAVGKVRSFLKAHCWKREREREKCLRSPNIVKSVYIVEWLYGIHTCGLFR